MSGSDAFSSDWLALREPADRAARDMVLAAKLRDWMIQTGARRILDIGCGSGATPRALAPDLPDATVWTLVDHNPALLTAARERILGWADTAAEDGSALAIGKSGKKMRVRLERVDLHTVELSDLIQKTNAEIVTASAFFDLASPDFIDAFAKEAREAGAAVYAALTYDGREKWEPGSFAEPQALTAFHAHMRTDKGLGPAAGPQAPTLLEEALTRQGYQVTRAPSFWRLSAPQDSALIRELAYGSVSAVVEALGTPDWLDDWADARSHATRVEIGHADILALPPA